MNSSAGGMRETMAGKKVLVTGAAGRIGGIVLRTLGSRYELSALDRSEVEGVPSLAADLADLDAISPAFEGQDAVVHLGAEPSGGAPWESVLPNNIVGTYNVMEACRLAGVRRVVFASTNHVVGYYPEKDDPYRAVFEGRLHDAPRPFPLLTAEQMRPDCLYGVSKAFGEALGSLYWDRYGISFIALRIGGLSMEEGWQRQSYPGLAMWLSHRDAAQLIERGIDAPDSVGFLVVYGISNNALRVHEIETAERVLGFRPRDDAGDAPDPGTPTGAYYGRAHP